MTQSSTSKAQSATAGPASPAATSAAPAPLAVEGSQGTTTIASSVVQKVAGIAAQEISGVYAMGGGVSRAFGAIRERIPGGGTSHGAGVSVEVGEKQAAIDLDLIVEYGAAIAELATAVRRNVIGAVEQMTGLDVVEVNIAVHDIHIAQDDDQDGSGQPSRVE